VVAVRGIQFLVGWSWWRGGIRIRVMMMLGDNRWGGPRMAEKELEKRSIPWTPGCQVAKFCNANTNNGATHTGVQTELQFL
jgi:hypothetical protein